MLNTKVVGTEMKIWSQIKCYGIIYVDTESLN